MQPVTQDSHSPHPTTPSIQTGGFHQRPRIMLESATNLLRDLRFVSSVSRLITAISRPFSLGCCVLVSASSGIEAVHCTAAYMHAAVVPLWTGDVGQKTGSRLMLLQQLLCAAATATIDSTPVILAASKELLQDGDQLYLLQHFMATASFSSTSSISELVQAFSGDWKQFVDTVAALRCMDELKAVRSPACCVPSC